MRYLAFDPSMKNWGVAVIDCDSSFNNIKIIKTLVIQTNKPVDKVNRNVKDIIFAKDLYKDLYTVTNLYNPDVIVAELPVGSQSSRAMVSYAMCITLLGVLNKHINIECMQPKQLKDYMRSLNLGTEKQDIINYIDTLHPGVLPRNKRTTEIVKGKAEHIADAILAFHTHIKLKRKL